MLITSGNLVGTHYSPGGHLFDQWVLNIPQVISAHRRNSGLFGSNMSRKNSHQARGLKQHFLVYGFRSQAGGVGHIPEFWTPQPEWHTYATWNPQPKYVRHTVPTELNVKRAMLGDRRRLAE